MNILNIILLSCSVAVTVAQKVADTSNDIIDGQRRNTGGYGLLRPSYPGGYNQGSYGQGSYNQGGYSQGGYNQGGYGQGGYNPGYGGYNGYNGGYGGASPGGYGQGYGGNQGYGGGGPGFGSYPGQGGYPGGLGGTGGYGGGAGGYPSGYGQGYPGYGSSGSGYRPGASRPGYDYNRPGFPELNYPGTYRPTNNQYRPLVDRPTATPYNYHTNTYYGGPGDKYRYSDIVNRYLGRKAGEIKEGEEKS